MTQNEIFEVLAEVLANKKDGRAVVEFSGEHKGETMLVDFTSDGEPFLGGQACMWSLQKDRRDEMGRWCGTDELDCGQFQTYTDAFNFVLATMADKEGTIYYDCF